MPEPVKRWKKAVIMAIAIAFIDAAALLFGTLYPSLMAWSVGSVGIITFFGILMLVNYLSSSPALDKGEMRKAIAGSFIAVYFVLVSLLTFTGFGHSNPDLTGTIIGHFTSLVKIIIIFYFGSSMVREYLKLKEKRKM